jgi:hypothetical protein
VRILSFFITSRYWGHSERGAFSDLCSTNSLCYPWGGPYVAGDLGAGGPVLVFQAPVKEGDGVVVTSDPNDLNVTKLAERFSSGSADKFMSGATLGSRCLVNARDKEPENRNCPSPPLRA